MSDRPAMIARPIPSSGEAMPVVGLGTWQAFDVGAGAAARRPLGEVLRLFLEAGGRMIDSSPMYGKAEGVVGDLVAESGARERLFLATKVWIAGEEAGKAQMRRSSELLRAEAIDLMQIHNLVDWKTQLATMRDMKAAGRIRYIGITHYTDSALPNLARVIASEPGIDFVQLAYSLAGRAAETELLPLAAERGVAVIINRPLGQGALFRAVRGRALPGWATEFDCTSWAQLFLKYILGAPEITCVIPATADPAHMADNLQAGFGRLPDERQRQKIRELWDAA